MRRNDIRSTLVVVGWLSAFGWLGAAVSSGQSPADADGDKERREEALRITRAAAAEYEIRVGERAAPLELKAEPVLRWSNPEVGDIYGNVFVWTRPAKSQEATPRGTGPQRPQAMDAGRPLAVGSLFHWFASSASVAAGANRSTMEHELISLAEEPLAAKFHGEEVWATRDLGVQFVDVPGAPAPAASEAQRLAQMRQLAKEFTGMGIFRMSPGNLELRLLPQPIYRYAEPQEDILSGGLFGLVRTTDPEILLLLEARGSSDKSRWQFAAVRMHSRAELWLEHQGNRVWEAKPLSVKEIFEEHQRPYTAFKFRDIPEFLKDRPANSQP